MADPTDTDRIMRQARAADLVAEAMAGHSDIKKISMYAGPAFAIIRAYLETNTDFQRVRIEVHLED